VDTALATPAGHDLAKNILNGGTFGGRWHLTSKRNQAGVNTDVALIEATLRGDQHAFGQLVRAHQNRIFGFVSHYIGDHQEAEDVVQETFIQAFRNLATFRQASSFHTWIYRIAHNLSARRRQQRARRPRTQLPSHDSIGMLDRSETGEQRLSRQERAVQVQAALAEMNEEYRTILILREMQDCDYDTIAEILAIPVGTVRSRLHRARLELRERLQPLLVEAGREQS
jgi:RNA polymerase sigma-70 factor (ECF subfamily)